MASCQPPRRIDPLNALAIRGWLGKQERVDLALVELAPLRRVLSVKMRCSQVVAAMCLGLFLVCAGVAGAQEASGLVGAWQEVSIDNVDQSGAHSQAYGPSPLGLWIFTANGRFSALLARPDLPPIASNNRTTPTADEAKAIVAGSLAYAGTYTVDAASKTLTLHLLVSTFANWKGTDQKRTYALDGDMLTLTNSVGSTLGGTAINVLKRSK